MKNFYTIVGEEVVSESKRQWTVTHIGQYLRESEIIDQAREVCESGGGTLSEVVGIPWAAIGEGAKRIAVPARSFRIGEEFDAAMFVLNSKGHTFLIFDSADPDAVDDFIQEATAIGLEGAALDLVESTQHDI